MKKVYSGSELSIPYAEMVRLRNDGKVSLGIDHSAAMKISMTHELKPTKHPAGWAFLFWNIVGAIGLFYSLYLTFTSNWWWIIIGLVGVAALNRANKAANASNLLEAAMIDENFYTKIDRLNGWDFRMLEEDARPFFTEN